MEPLSVQPGRYRTRNQRLVVIDESFEVNDAPQPGMQPVQRTIWRGIMYKADAVTPDSRHDWEPDGRYRTPLGVASQYDLAVLIEATPVPENPNGSPPPAPVPHAAAHAMLEQDLAHVLLDYATTGDETPFDTLTRLIAERDHGQAILAMLSTIKLDDESDADCVQRLVDLALRPLPVDPPANADQAPATA